MSEQRVGTYSIPGPYGPGHPYYEAGRKNGADGKHAVMRDDETYMNGWADGYAASREERSDDY